MIVGTVLCLGDSLTDGARAPSGYGYPERLVSFLDRRSLDTHWACLNRGVSGQVTWEILRRTPGAVRELAGLFGAKWCVVLAGTNDSKGGGDGEVGLTRWWRLWQQVVHWPLRYGIPTCVCTFPPVHPSMPEFTPESAAWLRKASACVEGWVRDHDQRTTCVDGKVVPVRLVRLDDLPVTMLCDGVHLTAQGYHEVAHRVADAILPEPKEAMC